MPRLQVQQTHVLILFQLQSLPDFLPEEGALDGPAALHALPAGQCPRPPAGLTLAEPLGAPGGQ